MRSVEMYYKPTEILTTLIACDNEMSCEQQGFLCGLIKEKRPKKIVEVGVAAGGTTCVLLKCVDEILKGTKVYSVDISERYWRDSSKKTGYMLDELSPYLKKNHELLIGKYLAERLNEIAPERDIDFLILDTVHRLPGELLDFLAAFPYLRKEAVVVLHDVILCHIDGNFEAYATKLLLDVVTADKYYLLDYAEHENKSLQINKDTNKYIADNFSIYKKCEMENIAAFQMTDDTRKYIVDCFSVLTIPWQYLPGDEELKIYRELISCEYDDECLKLWDCAIKMQKMTHTAKYVEQDVGGASKYRRLIREWRNMEHIFIYGFGSKGKMYLEFARRNYLKVDAVVVSDTISVGEFNAGDISVYHLSNVLFSPDECCFINAGERRESAKAIEDNIRKAGYYKILNK